MPPLLRYFGSKYRLSKQLYQYIPEHVTYVEWFLGGAGFLLNKPLSRLEIVVEIDETVTNFYDVLLNYPKEFLRRIELTPWSRAYYETLNNPPVDKIDQAFKFFMRSWMVISPNDEKSGFRTTTYGDQTYNSVCNMFRNNFTEENIKKLVERFKYVQIENRDYKDVVLRHDKDSTFHYADPPYYSEDRNSGTKYNHDWELEDHIKMLGLIDKLEGKIMLSGYRNDLYDTHLKDWEKIEIESKVNGPNTKIEVIWMNYDLKRIF